MLHDVSSPGFDLTVIALRPDLRVQGRTDPGGGGRIFTRIPVTERVLSFTFEDGEKERDVLKLKVDNHDLYFFDHPAWVKGNLVRFYFGYPGRVFGPRTHVIDGFRGFRELEITAVEESALANVPKCRPFKNLTRDGVVRQIVREGLIPGVKVAVTRVVQNEPARDWQQARQTDWAFLLKLAEEVGYEVFVEDDLLHFHPRGLGRAPVARFEYFFGVGDLLDFSIKEWRVTDRPAATRVASWDPIARKKRDATGSDANTRRDSLGTHGSIVLKARRDGSLVESPADASTGGATSLVAGATIDTSANPSQAGVSNNADAKFRRQEQGEIKAEAKIVGDPLLRAKSVIEIVGLSRQLSGKYYVQKVVHKIDAGSGYTSQLTLLKNATTALPAQDPQTLGRKSKENTAPVQGGRERVLRADRTGRLRNVPAGGS